VVLMSYAIVQNVFKITIGLDESVEATQQTAPPPESGGTTGGTTNP
jgi:hypothetical protein